MKTFISSLIIVALFFTLLETAQRVRYFIRFRSSYWLGYGFAKTPANYDEMLDTGLQRKKLGVENIEIPTVYYKVGYRKLNPKCTTVDYKVNSFGFRGKEFDLKKKEGVTRIVAMGGSSTFGAGVQDGFTYPEMLEKILGDKYEVINAGIPAAVISEINILYEREVIQLDPDIVIVNNVFNNIYLADCTVSMRRFNVIHLLNTFLLRHSLFYMTLREKMAILLHKSIADIYKASVDDIYDNFMQDTAFWKNLEKELMDIRDAARLHNIKLYFIKEPMWYDSDRILFDPKLKPIYERAYAMLDRIAGGAVIDTGGFKKDDFCDNIHLSPKGNLHMANLIAEKIKR